MNILEEQNVRELVKIAVDHNIVVFDYEAPYETLTEKLIYYMEETMYLNHKEGPIELYIPYYCKLPEIRYNMFKKIVYSIPLSKNSISEYYEKELQASYGPNGSNLVLMIGDNGTPLLGLF